MSLIGYIDVGHKPGNKCGNKCGNKHGNKADAVVFGVFHMAL